MTDRELLENAAKCVCGIKGRNDAPICAGPFEQYFGTPNEYCGNRNINGYLCGHDRACHGGRMKSEAELKEWMHGNEEYFSEKGSDCPTYYVQSLKIEQLFAGKKLVDAGAVVLSVEDAEALDSLLTKFRVGYLLAHGFDEHNKLRIAIDRAENAGESK
jgi:hypothetical protein